MTRGSSDSRSPRREMRFLCACVGPASAPEALDRALAEGPVDWGLVIALATSHHVIPLARRALRRLAERKAGAVSSECLARLRRDSMAIAAFNLRAAEVLRRLQGLLAAEGIALVPVKGPALALLAYGSTSMRQFEDLDLIVRREELPRAVERLEAEGYRLREIPPTASRARHLASLQDWSMRRPGESPHLDLKPVLISHALSGPESAERMARACRPLAMDGGRSLSAPGAEAMLLAVCLDGANEMWAKLSSVADAGWLLGTASGADWEGLLREARRFGQRRSLLVGARLAERLLGVEPPEAFRRAFGEDPAAGRLAGRAAERMEGGMSLRTGIVRQMGFAFQTRERARDRWRLVVRTLFVPGAAELNGMALPDALHPLYSCARPFRLAWDAWRGRSRRVWAAEGGGQP